MMYRPASSSRSEWHTPTIRDRTRTSPGPAAGHFASATSAWPGAEKTSARMVAQLLVGLWLRGYLPQPAGPGACLGVDADRHHHQHPLEPVLPGLGQLQERRHVEQLLHQHGAEQRADE